MDRNNVTEIGEELDEVLNAERHALLRGDTETVSRFSALKERLILSYGAIAEQKSLRAMQLKILRNQVLIDHSLKGMRAAVKRLSELRDAREQMQTYDSLGRRKTIVTPKRQTLEKRA